MVLDFAYASPSCGEIDHRPAVIARVHYMYFAMGLFLGTLTVMVVVSLMSDPPSPRKVGQLMVNQWSISDQSVVEL